MSVSFDNGVVVLEETCGVDEALPLLELLQTHLSAQVDMRKCTLLHSATLQVLMAAAPRIATLPEEAFLRLWLTPLFARER
jgi:hypothetical protein